MELVTYIITKNISLNANLRHVYRCCNKSIKTMNMK